MLFSPSNIWWELPRVSCFISRVRRDSYHPVCVRPFDTTPTNEWANCEIVTVIWGIDNKNLQSVLHVDWNGGEKTSQMFVTSGFIFVVVLIWFLFCFLTEKISLKTLKARARMDLSWSHLDTISGTAVVAQYNGSLRFRTERPLNAANGTLPDGHFGWCGWPPPPPSYLPASRRLLRVSAALLFSFPCISSAINWPEFQSSQDSRGKHGWKIECQLFFPFIPIVKSPVAQLLPIQDRVRTGSYLICWRTFNLYKYKSE